MSTLVISKESLKTWLHTDSILGDFIISKFYFNADNLNFQIVEQGKSKRVIYNVTDITLYNTIGGGIAETFTTITALSLRLEQLNYLAFQVDGQITSIANLIESGSGVTITGDGTEASPYIISATGGGGGSQTLAETLVLGNITDGTDISISDGDAVILDNGSMLKKGTIDAGNGGAKGISQICAVGYEHKWEAGRLYIMNDGGTTIREVSHNFAVTPTVTDDVTKGFAVNTRWILDNGDIYVCTDPTTGSAVWVLQSNGVPTLQEVTDVGNETTNDIIFRVSANQYIKIDRANQTFKIINTDALSETILDKEQIYGKGDISSIAFLFRELENAFLEYKNLDINKTAQVKFDLITDNRTIQFPDASGTLALAGATTATWQDVVNNGATVTIGDYVMNFFAGGGWEISRTSIAYRKMILSANSLNYIHGIGTGVNFDFGTPTGNWSVVWPNKSGTVAMTSDIPSPTSILTTTITDGDTTHAPDGNSVFDALANVNTNAVDKVTVKLSLGITKGQAVYISSANGTNIIVAKASNSAESTSSKTLGLLETTGVTNDIVNVITNGLLDGLDTSAATVGDAVWLGTSGNLIYGLASKPVAPAHLVYIGVVSRVSATVGEIIVKIQNGFELNEIHDVSISGLADNNLLAYESATSLWKNKTASTLGIAPLASPTFTGTVVLPSTTSIGTVSDTEIGYLDNVTSSIQTQFTNLHYKNILKDNSFWWTPTSVSNNAGATGFQYSPYSNNNSVVIQGNSNSINPLGYIRFSTTAVAGTLAVMRRNDFLILTGFSCTITRKIRFETNISGQRFFCGFSKNNQFTAPTNVEPNTLTDIVGVCQMSSSTNMQVVHNDASGTATLIDLGSSYPCNDTQYNYFITIEQTTTTYIVTVERVTVATGASISTSNTLSTNIPVYNTGTIQICTWITNNATASIASYLDGGGYGTFKN